MGEEYRMTANPCRAADQGSTMSLSWSAASHGTCELFEPLVLMRRRIRWSLL